MEYDPSQYDSTAVDALGPAKHLIKLIEESVSKDVINNNKQKFTIIDLGCGPGNCTQLLHQHFPNAMMIGVDIDPEMIQYAQQHKTSGSEMVKFFVQDLNKPFEEWDLHLREFLMKHPADVIFSNYALQWVFDPKIIAHSMKMMLRPETGILVVNILYGDITAEMNTDQTIIKNEQERKLLLKYIKFPDERQFIGDWLLALKNQAHLHNVWFRYSKPCSIYPEQYYCNTYVQIPLKWHLNFISNDCPESIRPRLTEIMRRLILKKRIKNIRPKSDSNNNTNIVNNNIDFSGQIDDKNEIEIEHELWIIVAKQV